MQTGLPHSHSLRKGRWSGSGQIYLVTFATWHRRGLLEDLSAARLVIRALHRTRNSETLAFVVMPDHVHWMIKLADGGSLPVEVQGVKSVTSHQLNSLLGRKGTIWQAGYHDHVVRTQESLVDIARYIVLNPVRAGLVRSYRDYPHWDAVWI